MTMKTPSKITQPELLLISDETTQASRWALDEDTKKIGRKGLAEARAALRQPAYLDQAA